MNELFLFFKISENKNQHNCNSKIEIKKISQGVTIFIEPERDKDQSDGYQKFYQPV